MITNATVYTWLKRLLAVLAFGVAAMFFAHGVLGLRGTDSFITLLIGTLGTIGIQIIYGPAMTVLRAIGTLDVLLSVYFLIVCIGALKGKGALYRLAISKASVIAFSWAALWAFLTAASRPMSEGWHGWFTHEILEFIERTPNYAAPLAALLVIMLLGKTAAKVSTKK